MQMAKNEEGEIDLTIGNKQLLSIVFILFVLFGVVFSMGYFVGRASSAGDTTSAAKPADAMPAAGRPEAAGPAAPAQPSAAAPTETAPEQPAVEPGEARVTEAPPVARAPAPAPAPVERPAAKPVEPVKTAVAAAPAAGTTYLQVAAKVRRDQAQMLADVLRGKGFRTVVLPMEDPDLYRTLVGPLNGASEIAKTKADIEAVLGIKPYLKKF